MLDATTQWRDKYHCTLKVKKGHRSDITFDVRRIHLSKAIKRFLKYSEFLSWEKKVKSTFLWAVKGEPIEEKRRCITAFNNNAVFNAIAKSMQWHNNTISRSTQKKRVRNVIFDAEGIYERILKVLGMFHLSRKEREIKNTFL